jgi:hypothetical protein
VELVTIGPVTSAKALYFCLNALLPGLELDERNVPPRKQAQIVGES